MARYGGQFDPEVKSPGQFDPEHNRGGAFDRDLIDTGTPDDDDGGWVGLGFARSALTVALSLVVSGSALCAGLQRQNEDFVPAGGTPQVEEEYWRNPTPPVQASLSWPQQWTFDSQEPAGSLRGQPDEDFWALGPPLPVQAALAWPQQWGFDVQEPAGSLRGVPEEDSTLLAPPPPPPVVSGFVYATSDDVVTQAAAAQPEEDFWVSGVAPSVATLTWQQQWIFDVQEPAGSLLGRTDEDFWRSGVAPVPASFAWPQPSTFDVQEPAGSLFGQPDEDFWVSGVTPAQAALTWPQQWTFDVQEPAGSLFGQPDEDFWRSGVAPSVATLAWTQQWGFDVQEPAGSLFGQPDEDFWVSGVAPTQATIAWPQQWTFDVQEPAGSLFGVPEEEVGLLRVASALSTIVLPVTTDDDIVPQPGGALPPDEDFWVSGVAPMQATLTWPQQWGFDAQEPAGSLRGVPEEDGASFLLIPPQSPFLDLLLFATSDDIVITPDAVAPEEDFWVSGVAPKQASFTWPQQWGFDVQEPAGSLLGRTDEDFWVSGVAPAQATLTWPQQWVFDVQEPAGSLFGVPEEDAFLPYRGSLLVPPPVVPKTDTDDVVQAPTVLPPDEDFWVSGVSPAVATLVWPQQWVFDVQEPSGSLYGVPEEDSFAPLPKAQAIPSVPVAAIATNDEIMPIALAADEDFWVSGVAPAVANLAWPQQWVFDVQEPGGSLRGVPEEDSFAPLPHVITTPPLPVVATATTDDVLPSSPPDEDFWRSGVAPVSATLTWSQQWSFDVQEPGTLRGQPDEDFWVSGVAPIPASLAWLQPFILDVQEPGPIIWNPVARPGASRFADALDQTINTTVLTGSVTDAVLVEVDGEPPPANVQSFTADGTWTSPATVPGKRPYAWVKVEAVAGGASGGTGARSASGVAAGGGGGGGGAAYAQAVFTVAAAGASQVVTVGLGGSALAGRSTNGDGSAGFAGTPSQFGALLSVPGGNPGGAGTTVDGGAGGTGGGSATVDPSASSSLSVSGGNGGHGSFASAGLNGTVGQSVASPAPGGGGGGGGIQSSSSATTPGFTGGDGGTNAGGNGSTGGGVGGAGTSNSDLTAAVGGGGGGGGGGRFNNAAPAGVGGGGGKYGAGSGGGGAHSQGSGVQASGGSQVGASGIVVVTTT